MSTGYAAIPLLKAAPERDQIADRLDGGSWRGLEVCLMPRDVADDASLQRAIEAVGEGVGGAEVALTAEAPVAWPSGAFVRVDRPDAEAIAGVERSADFAAAIGSPVLTIHLFTPMSPQEYRAQPGGPDEEAIERFLRFYARACLDRGVTPLIENVPPVLRMRTGGVYLSPVGGHWRDLLEWRERVPELRFTLDTSHAALFKSFAGSYPTLFGLDSDEDLELERYVEELGPHSEVAHVSDAHGLLGEGLPYGSGELPVRSGGRRVLSTGGGGSIANALATLLVGFRPEPVTLLDGHEASLTGDRRSRDPFALERMAHVLCDIRDAGRLETEFGRAKPDVVFHLAAYKHVDWAEVYPEEFVDTNLHGSWNVLRAAEKASVDTVVVASTDKAALAASFYGRTKRFMEQLTAYAARSAGAHRAAVRFVNVLGSAGSASDLFMRQARAGVPLTVTDTGMVRYWITMAHAATLAAHGALMAGEGTLLAGPADPAMLTVGELAERIWTGCGREGDPDIDLVGIRRGETLSEVITAPGEEIGDERFQGIAPITGDISTAGPAWVAERLPASGSREEARAVWLEAMQRPGLLTPSARAAEPRQ